MTIPEKVGKELAEEYRIRWINSHLPPHLIMWERLSLADLIRLFGKPT